MFDLAWGEILIIAVVAILVVGPKDLPRLMKGIGEWVGKARRMAAHFQSGVDEMIRQAELEDLRKDLNTIRRDLKAPLAMDPRTTTTPPPDNLMVSLGETPAASAPLPLPGPIEGPIAPPAPAPVQAPVQAPETTPEAADAPKVTPPRAVNE